MDPIVLEFDHRLGEHLAAERLYYRSTFWWKADRIVAVLLIAFGIFAVSAAGARWWTILPFPLAIAEWFHLLSIRPLQTRFWFHRNPKHLGTYRLSFSDSGIGFETTSIESKLAWTHYTRVLEGDLVTLLVYGTRMYTLVPRRASADDAQYARFLALVRRHVSERVVAGA